MRFIIHPFPAPKSQPDPASQEVLDTHKSRLAVFVENEKKCPSDVYEKTSGQLQLKRARPEHYKKEVIYLGRKNKHYRKSLHDQAYDTLTGMQCFGSSKRQAILEGTEKGKIFSFNTFRSYWKHIRYFLKWMEANHPECTTLSKAKKYVKEWLEHREQQTDEDGNPRYSAWTMHLSTSALCKLFQISDNDPARYHAPTRKRESIRRSRLNTARDRHFSETNNQELIAFCRGTGLRRAGLQSIRGRDLYSSEQIADEISKIEKTPLDKRTETDRKWLTILRDTLVFDDPRPQYYVLVTEKGGRTRLAPIIGEATEQIVRRFRETAPNDRVWQSVHSGADIHGYRADYAKSVYKMYARPYEELEKMHDNRDVLIGRKSQAGQRYDRQALLKASKALGHNREHIVSSNYIRGL